MKELTGRHVFGIFAVGFGTIIAVNMVLAISAVRTFPGLEVDNSYVASQQFGRMIWGVAPGATPVFGGTLCIGSAPVRMPITFSNGFAPGDCSGRLETDIPGSYW